MVLKLDRHLLVLDVETTGLHPERNDVLQVGLVVVNPRYMTKVYRQKWDVRLDNPFEVLRAEYRMAQKVHGIPTRRALLSGRPLDEVVAELNEVPYRYPGSLVAGDNVGFDHAFVKAMFERVGRKNPFSYYLVDLTGLAAVHLGVVGLGKIADVLGVDKSRYTKHDALGDAELTADCFIALLRKIEASTTDALDEVAGILNKETFGF